MTSSNGTTWTSRDASTEDTWRGIDWSPELGLFAAVAANNGSTNTVMTSPDGTAWTTRVAGEANAWVEIAWSPELGLFAAVANDGTNQVMINTAPEEFSDTNVFTSTTAQAVTIAGGGGENLAVVTPTFFGSKTLIVTVTVEAALNAATNYSFQVSSAGASCNGGAAGAEFSYTMWTGGANSETASSFTAHWVCTGATSGTAVQATHNSAAQAVTATKVLLSVLVI